MEIKKSPKSDLRHYRLTFFLVGVVISLLALYAVLEWSGESSGNESEQRNLLDELTHELDMIPLLKEDPIITAPKTKKKEEKKLEEIRVTDSEEANVVPELDNPEPMSEKQIDEQIPVDELKNDPLSLIEMTKQQKDSVFRIVQALPEFPGGMVEFMKWLTKNLRYPPVAQRSKIQGTCRVSFIVNIDGSISDVKLERGFNQMCENEALRVVKLMPKWKPGIDEGKPTRTKIVIPIVFRL